jgi:glycosyltransferase involved in cell wall biosynthesis
VPDPDILAAGKATPNLLFVGRLAPNKRVEDVIKVLYQYHQIEPNARLYLVGETRYTRRYVEWLQDFVQQLGLADAVQFTGQVSRADLAAYYQIADVFVMMSEHEGFGIPLLESMRFDLPIIAYASSAVPETLDGAGILIWQKDYRVIAELIHLLRTDPQLREHICQEQQRRAQDFAPSRVLAQFRKHLDSVIGS